MLDKCERRFSSNFDVASPNRLDIVWEYLEKNQNAYLSHKYYTNPEIITVFFS